jgi:butyrate kinase
MTGPLHVLVLNPGSTSTRIALFRDESLDLEVELRHASDDGTGGRFEDDLQIRIGTVRRWLDQHEVRLASFDAVVGRGGLLRPLDGGVYRVNESLLNDSRTGLQGRHPSNLGAHLAHELAIDAGAPAFVVDPVSVDEFDDLARLSGLAGIERRSLSHALSVRSAVRTLADESGRPWREVRAVVAHLGGGISICPVRGGRIVDANNAVSEGPFSPQRTGGLPIQELLDLVYSGQYGESEVRRLTVGEGGLVSYLGTDDAEEVERRIESGDELAEMVFRGLAYQVAKEIGAMTTVLEGRLDAVVLTGGLARSARLVEWIRKRVEFLAPVRVLPVQEMHALARGALAALRGDEPIRDY